MIRKIRSPKRQRQPAAVGDLEQIGAEKAGIDEQKQSADQRCSGNSGQCQILRMATNSRQLVSSMVVDTAVP
jgi:hypothetical protein